MKKQLNIVVALPAEARPFTSYYSLKKITGRHPFPVYSNADQTIYLVVSGIGKVKSAAATVYLSSVSNTCFLNIGIAGSEKNTIGDLFVANKITDMATRRSFFPSASLVSGVKPQSLTTFDIPQTLCPGQGMVDMEAAGFFEAASLLVSQEHIQVLKIISDNAEQSIESINKAVVEKLLLDKIPEIDVVVQQLLSLSEKEFFNLVDQNQIEVFFEKWHFSQYQSHQLQETLRRWFVVFENKDPFAVCQGVGSSREVLVTLSGMLEGAEVEW